MNEEVHIKPTVDILVRNVSQEEHQHFKQIVTAMDSDMSKAMRRMIREFIKKHQRKVD